MFGDVHAECNENIHIVSEWIVWWGNLLITFINGQSIFNIHVDMKSDWALNSCLLKEWHQMCYGSRFTGMHYTLSHTIFRTQNNVAHWRLLIQCNLVQTVYVKNSNLMWTDCKCKWRWLFKPQLWCIVIQYIYIKKCFSVISLIHNNVQDGW